jgi:hypothetical protein
LPSGDCWPRSNEILKANPPGGDAITINSIEIGEVVERV